jgi:spore coat protein CotH
VCVALVSKAELKAARPVALYGLGSGEEQEADNSIVTTFETFDGQDDYMKELLGDEYYVDLFDEIAASAPITEAVDEVKVAIDEAKNEHAILQTFAEGADAPLG